MKINYIFSAVVAFAAFILVAQPAQAETNLSFVYWSAGDCPPCNSWANKYEKAVREEMEQKNIRFIKIKRNSWVNRYPKSAYEDVDILKPMAEANKIPRAIPSFSYMVGDQELYRVVGYYNDFKEVHSAYIQELLEKRQ